MTQPALPRRFGLVHATALNMTNMIGIGPFITIPLLMSALGGPQAMLGWIIALVIVIADGMVWSELGAAMPGSGGSFGYLREAYGRASFGRLMGFVFVWQFVLSGPLEIASGYIGFSQYLGYIWKNISHTTMVLIACGVGVVNIAVLYRRINSIAYITVALWIGTLLTVFAVMITGALHFDHHIAFDFPAGGFNFSLGFLLGLGTASRIGVYDYLGYYDICYIGDEVKEPGRVIPRSILISTLAVAVIYLAVNLSIIGVVPWREFVPAANHPESNFVVSIFMEKIYGSRMATLFTAMILWTAFGSVFALLLGYSRVPYAAAKEGYFFKVFARLHPKGGFPHVSLVVLGLIAVLSSFLSLGIVIDALITTRILVQFIGQIGAVALLRRRAPDMPRPYRMWLYPLPSLVALVGWIFIFATTPVRVVLFGLGGLVIGVMCFGVWSWRGRQWPFAARAAAAITLFVAAAAHAQTPAAGSRLDLHDGWQIQTSAHVMATGDAISVPGFKADGWYGATVPTTVLAALVGNKVYDDPYFGMNLRSIPGTNSYAVAANFARIEMKEDSPFRVPWWYRTEFKLPTDMRGRHLALHFDGINYRANVWLNGHRIANSTEVAGTYRLYEFDVTEFAKPGDLNALAVEISAPGALDLAMNWVDWNPAPPDKDMGLWRGVWLSANGSVALRYPHVVTKVTKAVGDRASGFGYTSDVTLTVEVRNVTSAAVTGTLRGDIERVSVSQPVALAPRETKLVRFTPGQFPQLHFANPRLWWPAELGTPNLYDLDLTFQTGSVVSDRQSVRFGMREITSEMTPQGGRLFRINGRRLLIRGGGWAPDMLLRATPARQEMEMQYVRDMHLNTIRLEGKHEDESFFDLADRYGILVMAGWSCCDQWELWSKWTAADTAIAAQSQRDQIRRLRNRASVLVWLNGSDNPPPAKVESTYVAILKEYEWQNPVLSSATAKRAATGASGVKMTGPYDWVAPLYWFIADTLGGARGFNTETSPGPAVPPIESLRQMFPADHLWPIDSVWNFHAGGGQFTKMTKFIDAMTARYGAPTGVEDFAMMSQVMAYEGERAMFEAYARNKYVSTGVIQWMLNNGWPSLIWHLYDYYLRPGGGYFGAKKANEPLHVMYSNDDRSVVVVNGTDRRIAGMRISATALGLDATPLYSNVVQATVAADSSTRIFTVPDVHSAAPAYFLDLRMADSAGRVVSRNLYWLSTKPDVPDLANSQWYGAPTKAFADFTALKSLPLATVAVSAPQTARQGTDETTRITLSNTGKTIAFFVRLKLTKGADGDEVLPVRWGDNYVTLLPGETRAFTATYRAADIGTARPTISVSGWNVR
jgi:exo-1,4-beta-D-glucosaminidase